MLRLTPDGFRALEHIVAIRGYQSRTEAINTVLVEVSKQRKNSERP